MYVQEVTSYSSLQEVLQFHGEVHVYTRITMDMYMYIYDLNSPELVNMLQNPANTCAYASPIPQGPRPGRDSERTCKVMAVNVNASK